jgi:phospholipase C
MRRALGITGAFANAPRYKNDNSTGYYTEAELEFQFSLADAFTVCDA